MANQEQIMNIKVNGKYNNINLKELEVDNYFILEKGDSPGVEKEGQYGTYHIMFAKYNDTEVSFFLNPKQYEMWNNAGGIDDKVKVTAYKETINVKAGELTVRRLKFDLV